MQHISHACLSHIDPPVIPSPRVTQCVRIFFILQPLTIKYQWGCAYQADLDTKVLIGRLYVDPPLDDPTILNFPAAYRTDIARKISGLLEGRFLYYEPIPTVTKYICRIVIPTSLYHTIFNLMHATHIAGSMGK